MTFTLDVTTAEEKALRVAEESKREIVRAIDSHVEATARSKGYNDAASLAGYAVSTVPTWAAEAQAFVSWRDMVWQTAFQIFAEVQQGLRGAPTGEGVISELPEIQWPE